MPGILFQQCCQRIPKSLTYIFCTCIIFPWKMQDVFWNNWAGAWFVGQYNNMYSHTINVDNGKQGLLFSSSFSESVRNICLSDSIIQHPCDLAIKNNLCCATSYNLHLHFEDSETFFSFHSKLVYCFPLYFSIFPSIHFLYFPCIVLYLITNYWQLVDIPQDF